MFVPGADVACRGTDVLETIEMDVNIPHNYVLWTELDGDDVWVGTSKGLAWGKGKGYYPGLRERQQRVGQAGPGTGEKK